MSNIFGDIARNQYVGKHEYKPRHEYECDGLIQIEYHDSLIDTLQKMFDVVIDQVNLGNSDIAISTLESMIRVINRQKGGK